MEKEYHSCGSRGEVFTKDEPFIQKIYRKGAILDFRKENFKIQSRGKAGHRLKFSPCLVGGRVIIQLLFVRS